MHFNIRTKYLRYNIVDAIHSQYNNYIIYIINLSKLFLVKMYITTAFFCSHGHLYLAYFTVSAIDITIHDVQFYGMKLAGIILISIGFLLVMFPNNWPEYIFRLLR